MAELSFDLQEKKKNVHVFLFLKHTLHAGITHIAIFELRCEKIYNEGTHLTRGKRELANYILYMLQTLKLKPIMAHLIYSLAPYCIPITKRMKNIF